MPFVEEGDSKMNMLKILIIDDNEIVLLTMKNILKNRDFFVEVAANGTDGLEKFKNDTFDIVFLDLGLPDIHGLEILREIRDSKPELPVIIMTAYGKEAYFEEAMKLNASEYLEKPFDDHVILQAIEKNVKDRKLKEA